MARSCAPYHSIDGRAYHIYIDCTVGNNIERDKKRRGTGNLRLCKRCKKIKAGKLPR